MARKKTTKSRINIDPNELREASTEDLNKLLHHVLLPAADLERHTKARQDRNAVDGARLIATMLDAMTQALSVALPSGFVLGRNCATRGLDVIDLNEK